MLSGVMGGGWRAALAMVKSHDAYAERITAGASYVTDPSSLPIASPWASSANLHRIVYEDVFGADSPVNTRAAAMRVPAVARARNLIVSTICRFPLVAKTAAGRLPESPSWMSRTDDGVSPQLRLAWTVDDLFFYGWSCWARTNGSEGFPLSYSRVNMGDWSLDDDGHVLIDGQIVPHRNVTVFQGLHEGVLTFGYDALRDARQLYAIVRQRLMTPIPGLDLHQVDGADLSDKEIDDLIERWSVARNGGNGGVSYTSRHIEAKEMGGGGDGQLLIEARNAAALDLARVAGITAGMLDATAPKASLNYETKTGRNAEFVDRDLALYMTPITARLSMDDVMPRGQSCDLDLSDFTSATPSPTGPTVED